MARKKQPAPAKPRPAQRQNGGRKPSPDGPRPQVVTRVTRAELARLDAVCERLGLIRAGVIYDGLMALLDELDPPKSR